jgi:hypothetical protein
MYQFTILCIYQSRQAPWDCFPLPDCTDKSKPPYKFQHSGGVVLVKAEMLINTKEWIRQMDILDYDVRAEDRLAGRIRALDLAEMLVDYETFT